jgi:hypothetical protein
MFTFIKDHELFILNPNTGRIYKIKLSFNGQEISVIHENTLNFEADIERCIKENKAQLVRD